MKAMLNYVTLHPVVNTIFNYSVKLLLYLHVFIHSEGWTEYQNHHIEKTMLSKGQDREDIRSLQPLVASNDMYGRNGS